jgi:hypothetical protein
MQIYQQSRLVTRIYGCFLPHQFWGVFATTDIVNLTSRHLTGIKLKQNVDFTAAPPRKLLT